MRFHGTSSLDALTRSRQAFLRRAPHLGAARGTAFNVLRSPGEDNRSGLEERVRLKLGLTSAEPTVVVEHVLLRPVAGDQEQQSPLLAAARRKDPYSLQLTFVFMDGVGRFKKDTCGLKKLAEETVRAETPAHLSPDLLWLNESAFATLVAALDKCCPGAAPTTLVRSARDRLIDLLGIGETYPLTDVTVVAERLTVNVGNNSAFTINPGQTDVRYELYADGEAVSPPCEVVGTGAITRLLGPEIQKDQTFQIRATKLDRPERSVLLRQTAEVKVGLDTRLPVDFPGPALVDFGAVAEVRIKRTQEGARYQLAYIGADGAPVLTDGVMGTGGEISLSTGPVGEDTQIRVKVSRTFAPSERRADISDFLTTELSLQVRADPGLDVAAKEAAAILIASSQKSVTYRVFVRPLHDADFEFDGSSGVPVLAVPVPAAPPDVAAHEVLVHTPAHPVDLLGYQRRGESTAGNGGALELALGPLGEDSLVVIVADKGHSAIQLQQVVVALPRPDPAPGLRLTLSPGAGGPGSTLLVSGGQRGVFYHFRRADQLTELGLPAYFHRLDEAELASNHGLEQLRVEVDFVVTRDPPQGGDLARQLPLDPLVDLADLVTLAPGESLVLDVMAVWARTGVGWATPRQIEVIRSP